MTFAELEKAIARAYRNGDYRAAEDLVSERDTRKAAARDRWTEDRAGGYKATDNSRRSFKG